MDITEIVKSVFNVQRNDISPTEEIMSMPEWDSMDHMTLIMRLEQESGARFTGDEIAEIRTIADIERVLNAKAAKA